MINILLLLLVVRGAMETLQLTKNGSPTININVRKSNKAKRVSIRISGATNEVFLIVPKQVPILNAKQFAIGKERWIRKQLRSKFDISKVKLGSLVPVEGFYYLIEIGGNKRVKVENNKLNFIEEMINYCKKRIIVKEGTTVGLANGILLADGKKIYSAENLKVGLFK